MAQPAAFDSLSDHRRHLPMVAAMTFAMMAPLAVPVCRISAVRSRWWRSTPAVNGAFVGFMLVWLATSAALHVAVDLAIAATSRTAVSGGALVAIAWSLRDPARRARRLAACEVSSAVRPDREFLDAAALGIKGATSCVTTCAPLMAVVAVRPSVAATAVATAALLSERALAPRFGRTVAGAYLAVALVLSFVPGWDGYPG
ncbi:MAG: DUF2182 domain-containing protein [Acidimicrobiia bacterium]